MTGQESHPADVFEPFLRPILTEAGLRIDLSFVQVIDDSLESNIDKVSVRASVLRDLSRQLLSLVAQTLELELRAHAASRLLRGGDSKSRFVNFMTQLTQTSRLETFFEEYSPLRMLLSATVDRWVVATSECLARWSEDAREIYGTLLPRTDAVLTEIIAGAGDRHRNGRSVTMLQFDDHSVVIYKPRSAATDVHFYEFLAFLNDRGIEPKFRTIRFINKDDYAWAEFASQGACESTAAIERFYERQGGLLAVLYLLGATDMHAGNIIASGEHPVLVDLETLFHPLGTVGSVFYDDTEPARYALWRSIMRVGLLPLRSWGDEHARGIDFSGLGGQPGQLTPRPVPIWVNVGTDEMRIVKQRIGFDTRTNLPILNGEAADPRTFCGSVLVGFDRAYRMLITVRHAVLTEIFPKFSADTIRILLRTTDVYKRLVYDGLRPELLRDVYARELHFGLLAQGDEAAPHEADIVAAECRDLLSNDIPLFTTRADSCDLVPTSGMPIRGYFLESGLSEARTRYQKFSEEDLRRQKWIIRAAFICMERDTEDSMAEFSLENAAQP